MEDKEILIKDLTDRKSREILLNKINKRLLHNSHTDIFFIYN